MGVGAGAEKPVVGLEVRVLLGEGRHLDPELVFPGGVGKRQRRLEFELLGNGLEERGQGRDSDCVQHAPDIVFGVGDVVHASPD